jgi:hypothetical protein
MRDNSTLLNEGGSAGSLNEE